jgi:hypothetical protein
MPKTNVNGAPSDEAERAVRSFLTFLTDPDSLVDAEAVKMHESAVTAAKDPIDKLKAISALQRAQAIDPAVFRADFVRHAKSWAEDESVPASAFQQLGVPDDLLQQAGIIIVSGRGRRRRGATTPSQATSRRKAVSASQLEEGILTLDGEFTLKDVAERVGGSPATIKAAIERLEAQGKVQSAGERTGSRGRAARTWKIS